MTEQRFKRKPYYNIYKPSKKEGAGAALQFSYDENKRGIFLEAARQQGGRLPIGSKEQFDWSKKIVFKIGTADIGQLLLLFSRAKNDIACIHKPQDSSHVSALEVKKQTGDYDNYRLQLSRTVMQGGEKTTQSIAMYIDHSEMAILAHFVRECLTKMLGF
jgi:hypothetical protein